MYWSRSYLSKRLFQYTQVVPYKLFYLIYSLACKPQFEPSIIIHFQCFISFHKGARDVLSKLILTEGIKIHLIQDIENWFIISLEIPQSTFIRDCQWGILLGPLSHRCLLIPVRFRPLPVFRRSFPVYPNLISDFFFFFFLRSLQSFILW